MPQDPPGSMDIFGTDIWSSDCRFAGVRCLILWFNAKLSLLFPTRSTPDQSLRIWSHTWNLFAFLFWIASKYFLFFNSNHTHFFSAHLSSRMFSPIHPYSEWPALSLQVCVCEQDPLFNQKLNELMQIFVRFLIKCQKHPRSPKHSHAPFCKLMAHCAIQEPVHSALEQLMRVAFHRVIGIPYHAKHTTQTHFFCTVFPRQKRRGLQWWPKILQL